MKRRTLLLTVILCTLIGHDFARAGSASTVLPSRAKKETQPNGYCLTVRHRVAGRTEWMASPDGAKMTSPVVSMMLSGATGVMYLINPETKTYAEFKNNEVLKKKLLAYGLADSDKYKWTPWRKVSTGKLKNLETTVYHRDMLSPQSDKQRHLTSSFEEEVTMGRLPNFKFVDKFADTVSGLLQHSIPGPGILLGRKTTWNIYRYGRLETHDVRDELEFMDCKRITISKDEFTLPKEYKKCKTETEIMPEGMAFGLH